MSLILNESFMLGNYQAHIKIRKVQPGTKRPDGFKVNFVAVDIETMKPVLIIDNHAPFGYHMHPNADMDHSKRIELEVSGPYEALEIFREKLKELVNG